MPTTTTAAATAGIGSLLNRKHVRLLEKNLFMVFTNGINKDQCTDLPARDGVVRGIL